MQVEFHEWTVPASLRALLWWPPIAFLAVLLDPTAAAGTIAVVGAVLAVLGVLAATVGSVVARRLAQRRAEPRAPLAMPVVPSPPLSVEQRVA